MTLDKPIKKCQWHCPLRHVHAQSIEDAIDWWTTHSNGRLTLAQVLHITEAQLADYQAGALTAEELAKLGWYERGRDNT